MKTLTMFVLLLLSFACGPVPATTLTPVGSASQSLHASTQIFITAVASMPTCTSTGDATPLSFVREGYCTLKRCTYACCNLCGWRAMQRNTRVDISRVLSALPVDAYECELSEWQAEADQYLFDFTAGCVVR